MNDLETWDKYRKAYNLTSHNYDEFNADNIAVIIPYSVDIIDVNSVSPVFKAKVEKDFVKII